MGKQNHDKDGHEIPDPTPMAIPVGYDRPETLAEMVQRMTRVEVSRVAQDLGHESFEEADDFEVGDAEVVLSEHQLTPMQEEYIAERRDTPTGVDGEGEAPIRDAGTPAAPAPSTGVRTGRRAGDAPPQAQPYSGPERRGAPVNPRYERVEDRRGREAGQ